MQCSVCGSPNDELAVRCTKCRSYLQGRVANIDLFRILWTLLENPRYAFKTIALAEHKNYSVCLFLIVGVFFTSIVFFINKSGEYHDNLLNLLLSLILQGFVCGIALSLFLPTLHSCFGKLFRCLGSFRNAFSLLAYASTPIAYATIFLLPLKLLSFGLFYYTASPHPVTINETLFYTFALLDSVSILWSFCLVIIGTNITYQTTSTRSFFINFFTFILGLGIVYYSCIVFINKL